VTSHPIQTRSCAFYLRDGALKGAIALNAGRDLRAAMKLIEHRTPVDVASLCDPSTDLRKLGR
jgi:3-phenylpropionate/trans-cinnamate dioxygenase ferredoxin reductase subunit